MEKSISTFLGANTPFGFVSFFDELYSPYENTKMYIIKGGPGTGKSTFMKKVRERASLLGLKTESVYCSSDSDSLDGLIIPELSMAFADGTAPHVIEPKFPGASEEIINLGEFWKGEELFEKRDEIKNITLKNSLCHMRSCAFLSSAGKIHFLNRKIEDEFVRKEKLYSFAVRFSEREVPKISSAPGKKKRRFISAFTPKGKIFFSDTVKSLSTRIVGIEDEYGAYSSLLIDMIGESAIKKGHDVIFCYCPLSPKGECEHIIIPSASLSVVTIKKAHDFDFEISKTIHPGRFLTDGFYEKRKLLKENKKSEERFIAEGISALKKAKELHDDLEKLYVSSMDFDSLGQYTQKFLDKTVRM